MQHIILTFAKEAVSDKIRRMLSGCGYEVYAVCRSKAELMRTVQGISDVLIITSFKLPDATCDDLAEDIDAEIIAIIKPEQSEYINNEDIFKLFLPVNSMQIKEAAEMLLKRFKPHCEERTAEDKKLIETAKLYLMEKFMMDEAAAHRFLQKQSMNKGLTMSKTARIILKK